MDEDITGKYAVCSIGRIGVVTGRKKMPWGMAWVGDGIDGKPWSSTKPRVLNDETADVLDEALGFENE